MVKIEEIKILFTDNKEIYCPGDDVTGTVSFHVVKPTKVYEIAVVMYGWCETRWTVGSGDDEKVYKGKEEYCLERISLWGDGRQETNVAEGIYQKPFRFRLPSECPSSFKSKRGNVLYIVQFLCNFPGLLSSDKRSGKEIQVQDPMDVTETAELQQGQLQIKDEHTEKDCFFGGRTTFQVDLTLDKSTYAPGDVIHVNGQVFNGCNTHSEFSLVLIQQVTYFGRRKGIFTSGNVKSKDKRIVVSSWKAPKLLAQERKRLQNEATILIPSNTPSSIGLRNCTLIDLEYHLDVQIVGVRGLCPPILKLKRLPVVISNGRCSGNAGVNADIGVSLSTVEVNLPALPHLTTAEAPPPSYDEVVVSRDFQTTAPTVANNSQYYDWSQKAFTYS
ncbi:arrestin domain-containing protein 17-like [Clavelina lepadiformis]|uniref:arrestin domain-containing protein 17-like n=1 Tax=Clavelina lepadiformis TaxID=159417 RepID=UPI004041479D